MASNTLSPYDLRLMAARFCARFQAKRAEELYQEADRLEDQLFNDPARTKLIISHRKNSKL